MKNFLTIAAAVLAVGLASCQTKCPAYTQKAANRQASAITASTAQSSAQRQ